MDLPPDLARTLASLRTLAQVIGAGFEVLDVVVQDEYSHDVVVRHPAHEDVHLVFDTT